MGANIYAEDNFIGYYEASVTPGDNFWTQLESMQGCSRAIFEQELVQLIEGIGESVRNFQEPVGDPEFEFIWVGHLAPKQYTDWPDWCGTILVREPDFRATDKLHRNFEGQLPYRAMGLLTPLHTMANRLKVRAVMSRRREAGKQQLAVVRGEHEG